jgi:HAMP domain-containing protein
MINTQEPSGKPGQAPIALTPQGAAMTKSRLKAQMETGAAEAKRAQKLLLTQQTSLMERSKKLLDGHLDGTTPHQLYRDEQERINTEMSVISDRLGALRTEFEVLEQNLDDAIALAENCYEAYRRAPDALRRTYNQAFFRRILVTRVESVEGVLAQPFASIVTVTETTSGASPGV